MPFHTEEDDSDMESTVAKSAWLISDDEERSSDDRKLPSKTRNGPEGTGKQTARPKTTGKHRLLTGDDRENTENTGKVQTK